MVCDRDHPQSRGGRRLHQAFAQWRPAHGAHRACARRAAKIWQSAVHVGGKRCRRAEYDGLTQVTDWSIEHLAYLFENFNGWGYRLYHPHVKSPYLWSYSNHYTSGKYVGDGQWSETAVSRQCGAMVLLKRLQETGEIRLDLAAPDVPLATPQPASMPMTSDALARASSPMTWDALTQASIPMTSDGLAQDAIPIIRDALALPTAGEKVLPYDHSIVPQETGYWCGPAATQVVLNSRGIYVAESDLARSIGTHTGGTDYVGLIERDLDRRVPQAGYMSVYMPNDPPTSAQRERLWRDLVRGINAGWGDDHELGRPAIELPARREGQHLADGIAAAPSITTSPRWATTTPRARGRCGSPTPASGPSGTGAASTRSRRSSRRRATRTPTPHPERPGPLLWSC